MTQDFCLAPWFTLTIRKTSVKPCCLWVPEGRELKWKTIDDIERIWHSESMQSIRKNFLHGKAPQQCKVCLKHRLKSRKVKIDKLLKDYINESRLIVDPPLRPLQVDFQLGNICNLQCRTCGSWGSSNWFNDDKTLTEINKNFNRQLMPNYKISASIFKDCKEMFEELIRFDFKGGETMIHNNMIEMIENLVGWGNSSNIILSYITNGFFINKEAIKLWNNFKGVHLVLSLDGIDDLFFYIRGYDFKKFEENLFLYDKIEKVDACYNVTISIYNILDLAEINNWFMTRALKRFPCLTSGLKQDFDCNVIDPPYLDPTILPKKYKQLALENIRKYDHDNILNVTRWLEHIQNIPANEEQLKLFVSFTKEMDKRKGTDFLKIKPEFEELFKEYS